jgi:hypothetical protein
VHWIEDWLHVSPDGGSGAAEIAIWAGLIFLLVLAILVVLRRFGPPRVRRALHRSRPPRVSAPSVEPVRQEQE